MYELDEAKWLKENKVSEGTLVRVTRSAVYDEDGWGNAWVASMDAYIGKEFPVGPMDSETGKYAPGVGVPLVDENDDNPIFHYLFPYFVLEVV